MILAFYTCLRLINKTKTDWTVKSFCHIILFEIGPIDHGLDCLFCWNKGFCTLLYKELIVRVGVVGTFHIYKLKIIISFT